jgi:hypothetical protein
MRGVAPRVYVEEMLLVLARFIGTLLSLRSDRWQANPTEHLLLFIGVCTLEGFSEAGNSSRFL